MCLTGSEIFWRYCAEKHSYRKRLKNSLNLTLAFARSLSRTFQTSVFRISESPWLENSLELVYLKKRSIKKKWRASPHMASSCSFLLLQSWRDRRRKRKANMYLPCRCFSVCLHKSRNSSCSCCRVDTPGVGVLFRHTFSAHTCTLTHARS